MSNFDNALRELSCKAHRNASGTRKIKYDNFWDRVVEWCWFPKPKPTASQSFSSFTSQNLVMNYLDSPSDLCLVFGLWRTR